MPAAPGPEGARGRAPARRDRPEPSPAGRIRGQLSTPPRCFRPPRPQPIPPALHSRLPHSRLHPTHRNVVPSGPRQTFPPVGIRPIRNRSKHSLRSRRDSIPRQNGDRTIRASRSRANRRRPALAVRSNTLSRPEAARSLGRRDSRMRPGRHPRCHPRRSRSAARRAPDGSGRHSSRRRSWRRRGCPNPAVDGSRR